MHYGFFLCITICPSAMTHMPFSVHLQGLQNWVENPAPLPSHTNCFPLPPVCKLACRPAVTALVQRRSGLGQQPEVAQSFVQQKDKKRLSEPANDIHHLSQTCNAKFMAATSYRYLYKIFQAIHNAQHPQIIQRGSESLHVVAAKSKP